LSLFEIAKRRYSVRKYTNKKVEDEKLKKILEIARIAPTGVNAQPVRLIVVREEAGLEKLSKGARIYKAPLAIIVCADHTEAWVRSFDQKNIIDIDASIATDHMMLMATELGLGTVWVCSFDPKSIRQEFRLPPNIEPINILVIGYAAGEPASSERHNQTRKPLKDIVFYETY